MTLHAIYNTVRGFLLTILILPLILGADQRITIHVANWASTEELRLEQAIADEFMRLHPGIRVVIESIPSSYKAKIITAMAAGSPPDVFLLDSVILPTFVNRKLLIDLRPYAAEMGLDLSIYFQNVLSIAEFDSGLYALPNNFTPYLMYYNKTLFDRAGLSYPSPGWTWDDYLSYAKALTLDTDGDGRIDQFGTTFTNWLPGWIPWLWSNGSDVLSPDGTTAMGYLNSPASEEALRFLIDLRTRYGVAPHGQALVGAGGSQTGGTSQLFFTNRIGMSASGHWWLITLRDYIVSGDLSIGVVPLPRPAGKDHVTVMYESGWCVPKGGKHTRESAMVAAFFAGEYAGRMRASQGIAIPSIISLAEEFANKDTLGLERIFVEDVKYARQPWGTMLEEFSRAEQIAQDAIDEVMLLGRDLHEALTEAAHQIDASLVKYEDTAESWENSRPGAEVVSLLQALLVVLAAVGLGVVYWTKGRERKAFMTGIGFLTPSLLHLMVFVITPLIFALYLSFHKWNILLPNKPFVGLGHFKAMMSDRLFWNALKNTAIFSLHVPVGMVISLGIAVLLNQKMRGLYIYRTLFFLPSVSSFVAVALVWTWIYDPQFGLANYILSKFGIASVGWLTDPSTALISVMIMSIWMGVGYQMIIFLAGLQGIPSQLYEVAQLDGASRWAQFKHITLPLLTPTTFFVLVTSMIGSFQVFSSIYVMTQGGPVRSTDVVVYHIYQSAWEYLNVGYASAMSWILFIIIVGVTALQFKFIPREIEFD